MALAVLSFLLADVCNSAVDALAWKPGLQCPAGTFNVAYLMKSHEGAQLACMDMETRKRIGPYLMLDCDGVVIARGTLRDGRPAFMQQFGHCLEALREGARFECAEGTFYNSVVGDAGVTLQCLDTRTRLPNGPYEERDCAGVIRRGGAMAQGERTGEWIERYPDSVVSQRGAYCRDVMCGPWASWDRTGELATYSGNDGRLLPEPPASARPPVYKTRSSWSLITSPVNLGFGILLGASLSLKQPHPAFSFGYRQDIFFSVSRGLGVGAYLEALSQRTFRDGLYGGGLQLRLFAGRIKLVPSVGVDARWDQRVWGTSLTGGLYAGLHETGLLALTFGVRFEARQRLTPDRDTTFLLMLQIDAAFPIIVPWMLLRLGKLGGPWFPHG